MTKTAYNIGFGAMAASEYILICSSLISFSQERPRFQTEKLVNSALNILRSQGAGRRNAKPPLRQALFVVRHFKQTLRLTIYISTIIAAILLLGFRLLTNPVIITGHLKKNPKDNSAFVDRVMVFVKGDNKILAKVLTDEKGDFEITFTPQKEKSFDFYCTGLGIDTLLVASVTSFESDTPEMTFYIPGQLKRNALGKVLCPICKRTDKVYKIQYGDAPVMTRRINKNGDTTYSPIYKGSYQESCIVGPAKYYCDRDKAKF